MATVRNAGPVTVTSVGLLAIRWMGLWPSSAMVVALELLEREWHWMEAGSTTIMITICSAFRRPSRSMRTIDLLHAGFLITLLVKELVSHSVR